MGQGRSCCCAAELEGFSTRGGRDGSAGCVAGVARVSTGDRGTAAGSAGVEFCEDCGLGCFDKKEGPCQWKATPAIAAVTPARSTAPPAHAIACRLCDLVAASGFPPVGWPANGAPQSLQNASPVATRAPHFEQVVLRKDESVVAAADCGEGAEPDNAVPQSLQNTSPGPAEAPQWEQILSAIVAPESLS